MAKLEIRGMVELLTQEVSAQLLAIFDLPTDTAIKVEPVKDGFNPPMIFLIVRGMVGRVPREITSQVERTFRTITIRMVICRSERDEVAIPP